MAERNVAELQTSNSLANKVDGSKEKLFEQSRLSNNNEYINNCKFLAKVISADSNFVLRMVKFVIYAVIEIILKAKF